MKQAIHIRVNASSMKHVRDGPFNFQGGGGGGGGGYVFFLKKYSDSQCC